jgi:hypothetical protein
MTCWLLGFIYKVGLRLYVLKKRGLLEDRLNEVACSAPPRRPWSERQQWRLSSFCSPTICPLVVVRLGDWNRPPSHPPSHPVPPWTTLHPGPGSIKSVPAHPLPPLSSLLVSHTNTAPSAFPPRLPCVVTCSAAYRGPLSSAPSHIAGRDAAKRLLFFDAALATAPSSTKRPPPTINASSNAGTNFPSDAGEAVALPPLS